MCLPFTLEKGTLSIFQDCLLYERPSKESLGKEQLVLRCKTCRNLTGLRGITSQQWPWRWEAEISDNESPLALTVLLLYCPLSIPFLINVISRLKEDGNKERQWKWYLFFCYWWIWVSCPSSCTHHSLIPKLQWKRLFSVNQIAFSLWISTLSCHYGHNST